MRGIALAAGLVASVLNVAHADPVKVYQFRHGAPGLQLGTGAPPAGPITPPSPTQPALTYSADLSSAFLAFGSVRLGDTVTRAVSLFNTGTGKLSITPPSHSAAGYTVTTNCASTLAVNASCSASVQFTPLAVGEHPDSLSFGANALGAPFIVTLSGKGVEAVGALTADSSADFGSVGVGQAAQRTFTFRNSGEASALQTYVQVTGAGVTLVSNTCGTEQVTMEVPASSACAVTVQYAPTDATPLTGTVSLTSQAKGSPFSLALTGGGTILDAYGTNVTLLLHADGTLVDSSKANVAVSTTGTAATTAAGARFGTGSLALPGNSYALVAPSTGLGFGTGDFTVEAWVYLNGSQAASANVLDFRSPGGISQAKPTLSVGGGTVNYFTGGTTPAGMARIVALNSWHHVAYSRKGGVGRFFIDGTQAGSNWADAMDYGASSDLVIGQVGDARGYSSGYLNGNVDEVRVTKGVGRYTTNFAVPTAPFPNP